MSRPPLEPFDWPAFRKTFAFQPVPVWIISGLLLKPAARATPFLLRATCTGPARDGVANLAFVLYALALPPAAATLVYLLFGRRRMARAQRLMGDCCLALVLLISSGYAVVFAHKARASWEIARPGLGALRAACWK